MSARTKPQVYDSRGRLLSLGNRIVRGGEGTVYDLQGHGDLVGKVYHNRIDHEKAAKLSLMVNARTDRLLKLAAWPVDTLYDRPHGSMIGFLMLKVTAHKDIHRLYGVKDRLTAYPDARWPFLIQAASNVARSFGVIHEHGHVIGDVNHGSIGVSNKATVTLFDCDSFQITAQGHQYLCEVGVDTHTPPELQGRSFRGLIQSPNHDAFRLAVVIFQLLFMGRHPFAGTFLGSKENPPLRKLIEEYRFAYGPGAAGRQMRQPPGTLPLEAVSQGVANLFEQAFARTGLRPKPGDWIAPLSELASNLAQCGANSGHQYLKTLAACPWCKIEAQSGIVVFTPVYIMGVITPHGKFNITSIWAQIEATPSPGPPPPFPDKASFNLTPSPKAARVRRSQFLRSLLTGGALIAASAVLLALPISMTATAWLVVIAGVVAITVAQNGNNVAKRELENAKREAERRWHDLEQRWKSQAEEQRFHARRREFEARKTEYQGLPGLRQRKLHELEKNIRQRQLYKFLDKHRIEWASISGIGPGRQATLRSYGIETAADVSRHAILAVPGFGPTYTSKLLAWRSSLEQRFVFNPAQGVDSADREAVEKEITSTRLKIEQELQGGAAQLRQISHQIRTARDSMRPIIEETLKGLAQAELDAGGHASSALMIAPVLLAIAASLISIAPLKAKLAGNEFGLNGSIPKSPSAASAPLQAAPSQKQNPVSTPTPSIEQRKAEAQLRYAEGVEYTKVRRYQDAVNAYQQAIALNPDFAEAHHELAFALYKVGKYRESVASSQQAIKLKPDNADTYRNLGLAYQALRQWKEAIEALNQSLKIRPSDAATYYQLGLVWKNSNNIDAAIEALKEAVKLKPEFALAHYELGLAYIEVDETQLANEQYNVLLSINSKLAEKLSKSIPPPMSNQNNNQQ